MKMLRLFWLAMVLVMMPGGVYGTDEAAETAEEAGRISGDIFEMHGGFLHAFLSVGSEYTDNLFNDDAGEETDLVTRVSPGIWLMLPGGKEKMPETQTSSITPGGVVFGSYEPGSFRRMHAYLFYSPEFEFYRDNSDEDTVNHTLAGFFRYRFPGGLSVGGANQFLSSYDERASGDSSESDEYDTNLLQLDVGYVVSPRMKLQVNYANYLVDYQAGRNDYRDRTDHSITCSLFYQILNKTAIFGEYEYIRLVYDSADESDSVEHHYLAGLRWAATAKSSASIKGGWQVKDFTDTDVDAETYFFAELQLKHRLTAKTQLGLAGVRRVEESNISANDYVQSHILRAFYAQQMTTKISGKIDLNVTDRDYKGGYAFGDSGARADTLYRVDVSLDYAFKPWLTAGLAYTYKRRDSNYADYEYTTNTVGVFITGSI